MTTLGGKDRGATVLTRDEDKSQLAFTRERLKYNFNQLPQGYKHSPPLMALSALAKLLGAVEVPRGVPLGQLSS